MAMASDKTIAAAASVRIAKPDLYKRTNDAIASQSRKGTL